MLTRTNDYRATIPLKRSKIVFKAFSFFGNIKPLPKVLKRNRERFRAFEGYLNSKQLSNDYPARSNDYRRESSDYRATIKRLSPGVERLSSDYENGMEKPAFKY